MSKRLEQGRGGGPCESCDRPEKAHDVRRMATCDVCAKPGLDLAEYGEGNRAHVRCMVRLFGLDHCAAETKSGGFMSRVRFCCLGSRRMQNLLRKADRIALDRRFASKPAPKSEGGGK
jgi:hypothetical protein